MRFPALITCALLLSVSAAGEESPARSEVCLQKPARAKSGRSRAALRHADRLEIIDSSLTLAAALDGEAIPDAVRRDLTLTTVSYWSFDHRMHRGQIVIHKDLASDVQAIFQELRKRRFPIARVVPTVRYGWSDEASMADNNTSGFNYRCVPGKTTLSNHAFGRAIDINPVQNPYLQNGLATPPGAVYDPAQPGTIMDGPIVRAFERRGWHWGGRWRAAFDWQHFDKVPKQALKAGDAHPMPSPGVPQYRHRRRTTTSSARYDCVCALAAQTVVPGSCQALQSGSAAPLPSL